MPFQIRSLPLLKEQRVVCLGLPLWWELGTNFPYHRSWWINVIRRITSNYYDSDSDHQKTSPYLFLWYRVNVISEALPGFWGNRGIRQFFQGNKSLKLKGTGERRQFWGTGNIENQDFDFGEQGKMPIFQGNKGTGTPSLGGLHLLN